LCFSWLHEPINLSAVASGTGGFVINGENADGKSGISVSNAGDVNGDGLDDLIIGAFEADVSGKSLITRILTINNKPPCATGNSREFNYCAVFFTKDDIGLACVCFGDGLDDLIVGAHEADSNGKTDSGKSYVIFGRICSTTINVSAIASGTGGFVIT
jgi:hypothetical protein